MSRAYFVNNMYLSSIQNGIQAGHVIHELFRKYMNNSSYDKVVPSREEQLYDWADNHKTMIVLNGGMTEHMVDFLALVEKTTLPHATFFEPGIGNALTSIGIIVPERMYKYDEVIDILEDKELSSSEKQFLIALKQFSLAK